MITGTPQDRRVRRTRQRLNDALMELVVEKGYDKMTVQDLIDRADVGRSTFYAHYETKDDLLVSGLDHLTHDLELHIADEPAEAEAILPSLGVFRHVGEHHELFRALIGSRGIDLVHRAAQAVFAERARAGIDRRAAAGERSAIPADLRAAFIAGSLHAFMVWWLDNDMPCSPEAAAAMFRQMTEAA